MRRLPLACLPWTTCLPWTIAIGMGLSQPATQAQSNLPTCQPPTSGEYLLLSVTPNADAQAKVYAVLPASFQATPCNYLNETVLRIGGFATQEAADTWATYIAQQSGTATFVARPPIAGQPGTIPPIPPSQPGTTLPGGSSPIPQPINPQPINPQPINPQPNLPPNPQPTVPTTTGYNPQALGSGYAVLVNYYNRPETATQVQQVSNQNVGLVSYGQKPYLLASFGNDQAAANDLLQRLTDKGLWAMVVDGRRVMLLKAPVR